MQNTNSTVSVIVPIFNVDIYLRKCLDSLAAQTLEGLEIILVNDGSTDYSADIAQEYVRHYPERFHYYEEQNSGLSAARNYGFSLSHGEYVAFVDSDDFVAPDIYRLMYEAARRDDADMVCCGYDRVTSPMYDPDNISTVKSYRFHAMEHSGHAADEYPDLLHESACYAWNKLYRRYLPERFPFPVGQKYEDSAVTYSMLQTANRISLVNTVGYYYRVRRAGAITADPSGITDIFLSMDSMLAHFSRVGKQELYHDELAYLCFRHLLFARVTQLKTAPTAFNRKYLRRAFAYLNKHFPDWRDNPFIMREKSLVTPKYEQQRLIYASSFTFLADTVLSKGEAKLRKLLKKSRKLMGKPAVKNKNSAYSLPLEILQDIQANQRGILRVIHSFCAEHGLRYYAAEGSLLGAVRHEGFIPWDDDMDLAMPREDYEKLIALWGSKVYSDCVLLSRETYPQYYLPFIKIVQNRNIRYKTPSRKTPEYFQGLSIDIFPLDAAPAYDSSSEKRRLRRIRVTRDMMLYKVGSLNGWRRKFNCIVRGAPLRSMSSLQDRIKALCTAYRGQDVPCLSNYCSSYPPVREVFPREWWGEPHEGRFDDTVVMLPQQSDLILSTIYGAYLDFPPEEQQVCKHRYQRVEESDSADAEA